MKPSESARAQLSRFLKDSASSTSLEASGQRDSMLELARQRYWSFFVSCFEDERARWIWHDGDIEIEGDLTADTVVVVNGDLRVSGNVFGSSGILFVLGSLQAQNLITDGSLAVVGPINIAGLLLVHYNDHVFRAGDVLRARAFVVDDMDASFERGKLEVEAYVSDQSWKPDACEAACRTFHPDLISVERLVEGIEEHSSDQPFLTVPLVPDLDECYRRLAQNEPLFRAMAPGPDLGRSIMRALEAGADGDLAGVRALRGRDSLVDRIVDHFEKAAAERIPRTTSRMRAAAADKAVLEPMGVSLEESVRTLASCRTFEDASADAGLQQRVSSIKNTWIRADGQQLLKDVVGKATLVSENVSVSGAVHVTEPLIIDGDLVIDGTLALSSASVLVTGDLEARNLIMTGTLCVLGALRVAETIAGRTGPDQYTALGVAGPCSARLMFLENLSAEYGAGPPTLADGPKGEYGEWEAEESAAAHAALAPAVVDFEALLEDVYEGDTEFPSVPPQLDFPAAWAQLAAHGTLLRQGGLPADLPGQLLESLVAARELRPERVSELRSGDPLLERIACIYG